MRRTPAEFSDHPARYLGGLYRGVVTHVTDADTIDVLLDLGCNHYAYQAVRLAGVNAPERGTPDGAAATQWATAWCADYRHVVVVTVKDREKFGRYLAVVYPVTSGTTLRPSLNERLLAEGHAVPFMDDGINFDVLARWVSGRLWGTQ